MFAFWLSYIALWSLVIVLAVALSWLMKLYARDASATRAGAPEQGPRIGSKPAVIQGTALSSGGYRDRDPGRPSIIVLMSATCMPCQQKRDLLRVVSEQLSERLNVVVVCEGSETAVREFAEPLGSLPTVIADDQGRTARAWGVVLYPFALAMDSSGVVFDKAFRVGSESLYGLAASCGAFHIETEYETVVT